MHFQKNISEMINDTVFGKIMEKVRKHKNIKFVLTNKRKNCVVSEANYYTKKYFSENLLAVPMKKIKVKMDNPVYPGLSILKISKTLMDEC